MLLLIIVLFVDFSFSPSKFSVTNFLASVRVRIFKFCMHIESGQVYCGTENKTDIYFAFFLLFSISHSNVIHLEICDKYFPGTIAHRILLFGTSIVNHSLFYVKENQVPPTYSSLFFFIFLSLQFSNIKNFISLFWGTERHTKLKLGPHMDNRLMYHVYLNQAANIYSFISSIFFLSNSKTNFLSHFSVRPINLIDIWANCWSIVIISNPWYGRVIYCVHQLQAARIYLFLYFSSFFLSLQLAKIKNLLLQNCFNIPLMATAGGMWALLTLCYIFYSLRIGAGWGYSWPSGYFL